MLAGIDSAETLSPAMLDAAGVALHQPVRVVNVYLDAYAGGRPAIALAHEHGAAVTLTANSTTVALVRGDYAEALAYGHGQAALARSLGAPAGVGVAVDIEAVDAPTPDWIAGVVYALLAEGYLPIIYCSLRAPASVNALLQAPVHYPAMHRATIWTATPCLQSGGRWDRGVPAWQADHLAGYAVVGWQFAESVALTGGGGSVDLDLWDEAYTGLWRAPAAAPPSDPAGPDVALARVAVADVQAAAERAAAALRP